MSGDRIEPPFITCPKCQGEGRLADLNSASLAWVLCPKCDGTGRAIGPPYEATELGAIAFRLDAIAGDLAEKARVHGYIGIADLACKLWGAMDDLVAWGQNHE